MIIYSLEKIISKNREKFNKLNIKIPYLLTINAYLKESKIRINQNEKNRKIIEKLIKDYENLEKYKRPTLEDKKNIEQFFENRFKKASNNISLLRPTSLKKKIFYFFIIFKRVYEHFIIFAFISCIAIKINIWSIVYMVAIILLLLRRKNIYKFYYIIYFSY